MDASSITHSSLSIFPLFYTLFDPCASSRDKAIWKLDIQTFYPYLCELQEPVLSLKEFKSILETFKIKRQKIDSILDILAAILHLGNLEFKDLGNGMCSLRPGPHLQWASELLDLPDCSLLLNLFCSSSYEDEYGLHHKPHDTFQAAKERDKFVHLLYESVFEYILECINTTLCADDSNWNHYISFLEIPSNSISDISVGLPFLLKHYTYERLKNYIFDEFILKTQKLWEEDSLGALNEPVPENNHLCQFFQESLLSSLGTHFDSSSVEIDKSIPFKSLHDGQFKIQETQYNPQSFDLKNYSHLLYELKSAFKGMQNLKSDQGGELIFLKELLFDFLSQGTLSRQKRFPSLKRMKNKTDNNAVDQDNKWVSEYMDDLNDLICALKDTELWIYFHLNSMDSMNEWDSSLVISQLDYFEITKYVQQSSINYSIWMPQREFITRYRRLFDSVPHPDDRMSCIEFIKHREWQVLDALVGSENAYLSEKCFRILEKEVVDLANHNPSSLATYSCKMKQEDSHFISNHFYVKSDTRQQSHRDYCKLINQDEQKVDDQSKAKRFVEEDAPYSRKRWIRCTHCLTFCIPSSIIARIIRSNQKDHEIAWREKVAFCILILFLNALLLFVIICLGYIICPSTLDLSTGQISLRRNPDDSNAAVYMYGSYFEIKDLLDQHVYKGYPSVWKSYWTFSILGRDVSPMFPKDVLWSTYCPSYPSRPSSFFLFYENNQGLSDPYWYIHNNQTLDTLNKVYTQYYKGRVLWNLDLVKASASADRSKHFMIAYDRVYDISAFYSPAYSTTNSNFMGPKMKTIFDGITNEINMDVTGQLEKLKLSDRNHWSQVMTCLNGMFFVGLIDHRNDLKCQITNILLFASSCIIVLIVLVKFIASLQFKKGKRPENHDRFVICQVSCYTEGEESLKRTIRSIAKLNYDYQRRLLFIVCDGMIIGYGNDRPTPRIVLDILGVDTVLDPEPKSYTSIVQDQGDEINYAQVYSGMYTFESKHLPFVVVVKVGSKQESEKPGNRGKRDSQMILMQFLSRLFYRQPFEPLQVDLYHHIQNIIGVNPDFYEFLLMVDADTVVESDSLNHLVASMAQDSKISGICGETKIGNSKDSWITMLQVYEYFISHHLSKAFESLFGSVLCLPGCFSMYRLRSLNKPILIKRSVIDDYGKSNIHTLHGKNLLHLGEDRFLTTTILKHFPTMKTCYNSESKCSTNVPDSWSVLISQRRRWINSTIHNFIELLRMNQLCGFCCFSMRFMVIIDLFSTLLQPSGLIYILYLIYVFIVDKESVFPWISLLVLGSIYGLQLILLIVKNELELLGWMIIHILATPFFSFFLPIYSFIHMDDFSWGSTRQLEQFTVDSNKEYKDEFLMKEIHINSNLDDDEHIPLIYSQHKKNWSYS